MSWNRTLKSIVLLSVLAFFLFYFYPLWFNDIEAERYIDLERDLSRLQISLVFDAAEAKLAVDLLNCARLFTDFEYAQRLAKTRLGLEDPSILGESCAAIKARWSFRESPLSAEEDRYPIAYVRIVYRDYLFLEQLLSAEYQPQNIYCYVVDVKSEPVFKRRISSLAKCFPNVLIADEHFDVKSNGKNDTRAFLAGLRAVLPYAWNYAIILHNHDVPLKTNLEKVRILKVYNGANDVGTTFVTSDVDPKLTWGVRELQLFKNAESMSVPDEQLHLTKSVVEASLSREAAEYIAKNLSVDAFIDQLELSEYAMDEHFLSTLNSNEVVGLPGGFTTKCLENGKPEWSLTRKSYWKQDKVSPCRSRLIRHTICIPGVEDLAHLQELPHIYLNKMMPTVDYGAVACWLRLLREREAAGIVTVNETIYSELLHVRYNRWKRLHPKEPAPFCEPDNPHSR